MAKPVDDAIARYMANRLRATPPKLPTAKQAEAAGQRVGEAANLFYAQQGYQIASLGPQTTSKVKVDPATGEPVFPGGGDSAKPTDWSAYLGIYGLPQDVLNEINAIFSRTPDIQQAVMQAQAYVRGTPWYSQTYPGIQEAIAKGIVRDERDYRAKQNEFNQVFRQWTNTDITPNQYATYLREGVDPDTVARRFAGDAYVAANRDDIQYYAGAFGDKGPLGENDLTAVGRQVAGLGSKQGINLQGMLDRARQRAQRVFEGSLATFTGGLQTTLEERRSSDIGR